VFGTLPTRPFWKPLVECLTIRHEHLVLPAEVVVDHIGFDELYRLVEVNQGVGQGFPR